jgi:Na+/melibiose symporter-like transporter
VWVQRLGNKVVVATGLVLVATSFVLFLTWNPDTGPLVVIGVTVLMGLGMANVLAPCTDSIMGSLPRAKAGVGSAVNDTTRQMGGAVGVAVFGSLMASHFHSTIAEKLGGVLPAPLFAQVRDNVGQAIGVAKQVPAARPYAGRIASAANDTFVSGLHIVGLVAAGITLLAALGVVLFLPARARDDAPVPESLPEPETVGAV